MPRRYDCRFVLKSRDRRGSTKTHCTARPTSIQEWAGRPQHRQSLSAMQQRPQAWLSSDAWTLLAASSKETWEARRDKTMNQEQQYRLLMKTHALDSAVSGRIYDFGFRTRFTCGLLQKQPCPPRLLVNTCSYKT